MAQAEIAQLKVRIYDITHLKLQFIVHAGVYFIAKDTEYWWSNDSKIHTGKKYDGKGCPLIQEIPYALANKSKYRYIF